VVYAFYLGFKMKSNKRTTKYNTVTTLNEWSVMCLIVLSYDPCSHKNEADCVNSIGLETGKQATKKVRGGELVLFYRKLSGNKSKNIARV